MKRAALILPALILGIGFFGWPMASIIATGLAEDPDRPWTVLADPGIRSIAWFTVWQAAISTLLTLAVGLPLAFVLSRYRFPGRTVLRTLVTIPFVLPTVVVALAFISLIGPSGTLGVDLVGTAAAV
ncbi:MAG: iron ABC transporter permease, partial [Actinobacteria bacterium]|nr:iron ABC transporter permease [Actinomycetota bacterium]NIS35320.1 iron ABC transporter permease [Actinomycetota bacterium]NIT98060.1 iron ABC transporter permease [Actinomycetota bacterium]NIU21692.1 iron ABC transporter permease [Actinomycetota bacterium]NIU70024.1 iron ABC transporter permease [Actinomycetota bacterium]